MSQLENVVVERISLLTSDNTPAVPKAEARFALFKSVPQWMTKLQKFLGLEKSLYDDKEDREDDVDTSGLSVLHVTKPSSMHIQRCVEVLENNAKLLQ